MSKIKDTIIGKNPKPIEQPVEWKSPRFVSHFYEFLGIDEFKVPKVKKVNIIKDQTNSLRFWK